MPNTTVRAASTHDKQAVWRTLYRSDHRTYYTGLKYVGNGKMASQWTAFGESHLSGAALIAIFTDPEVLGDALADIVRTEPEVAKHISIVTFVNQETK